MGVLAVLGGAVLIGCTARLDSIDQGSAWPSFWMAPVRLCFPFVTGIWLYRVRDRLPSIRLGWLTLTLLMTGIAAFPTVPPVAGIPLNGLFEALCVVLVFPLIVHAGSHSDAGAGMMRLCRASGRISYPIYITHFPFLYIWMNYVANEAPSTARMTGIGLALVPFLILVAWAAYKFWDEPVRRRLRIALAPRP